MSQQTVPLDCDPQSSSTSSSIIRLRDLRYMCILSSLHQAALGNKDKQYQTPLAATPEAEHEQEPTPEAESLRFSADTFSAETI